MHSKKLKTPNTRSSFPWNLILHVESSNFILGLFTKSQSDFGPRKVSLNYIFIGKKISALYSLTSNIFKNGKCFSYIFLAKSKKPSN